MSDRESPEVPESEPTPAEEHRLRLRKARLEDHGDIVGMMAGAYRGLGGPWSLEQFRSQLERFPEGQICVEDEGKVVATVVSLIVDYDKYGDHHTYRKVCGQGFLTTHDPHGDTLYCVELFVHPQYRGLRLGRRLYDALKQLCEQQNLRRIVVGSRIPGYAEHAKDMTPQRYISLVKNRELFDPVLSFQLGNDLHVRRVIKDYLPTDQESRGNAVLLQWTNIYYEDTSPSLIGGTKSWLRVGSVQLQMRSADSVAQFLEQVEFFVDAVSSYKADFVLFPEFLNAPLLARYQDSSPADAMRELAECTEEIRTAMVQLAVSYNINIIAGSMVEYEDQRLRNVAYLCRRDGTWDRQYKLHVTPDETHYWGMQGGDRLQVFDTDVGPIGILICFDVEFPELPRLLAEAGMRVLFVPYWTDTKNGYLRVRHCAQARAIENECYVVITGGVGNLPHVENMDIQYSQSAVLTPSDFAFPPDSIAAEATPNTEMTLIADLDLDLIKELRRRGSVRNLSGRRSDLYRIEWTGSLPVVPSSVAAAPASQASPEAGT